MEVVCHCLPLCGNLFFNQAFQKPRWSAKQSSGTSTMTKINMAQLSWTRGDSSSMQMLRYTKMHSQKPLQAARSMVAVLGCIQMYTEEEK